MYLVFDVGGTFIKYAHVDDAGNISDKGKFPSNREHEDGLAIFLGKIEEIYRESIKKYDIKGIAMALPGQIDVEKGYVNYGGGLKWLHHIYLGEMISKVCDGIPVSLENDGKCAALAEIWLGNASDCKNAAVLVFGTGIGCGIVIDRHIHRGNRLLAGEISYAIDNMTLSDVEKIIPCEEMNSVEETHNTNFFMTSAVSSTAALTMHAAKLMGMNTEDVSGEMIYNWVEEGNQDMINLMEENYFTIAKMCYNLYLTIDPDVILIGGGISANPLFVEGIKKYVDKIKKITDVASGIRVDSCKYLNDSNLLGALYNFKQKYEGAN